MAKEFSPFEIDFDRCRLDLVEFQSLLDEFRHGVLKERGHVLAFFRDHINLAALVGHVDRNIGHVDRIAYEFDFFGDYAADLAVGDTGARQYCFVEFENAAPDGIFKKAGKKATPEWSSRFDHGYSQIIDWFWKLHDLAQTHSGRARFGHVNSFNDFGLLVIGWSDTLAPVERERLDWRRSRVVVDSRKVHCMTYDELDEDLDFQLKRYAPAALVDSLSPDVAGPNPPRKLSRRHLPRKFGRKSGRRPSGWAAEGSEPPAASDESAPSGGEVRPDGGEAPHPGGGPPTAAPEF